MKIHKDSDFKNGWFIGNFEPTLLPTKDFEVSSRHYKKGDREARHLHKIATEYTVIGSGVFKMNGKVLREGDIVVIEPGESTDFECIESGTNFVVKTPSVIGDKYLVENE